MSDKGDERPLAERLVADMEVKANVPKRGRPQKRHADGLVIQRLSDGKRLMPADPPEVQDMDRWLGNEPRTKRYWE